MAARTQLLLTPTHVGAVLRSSRKAAKTSQAELAVSLGLSQARISHLEQNPKQLSLEQLMAWCAALGLELYVGTKDAQFESQGKKPAW